MVDINNVVAGTISEFISYALWITAILATYYFIRFVMGTEKKEDSDGDGLHKIKDWLKSKKEQGDEEKEKEKNKRTEGRETHVRERLMRHVIRFLVGAEGHAHQAQEKLRDADKSFALSSAHHRIDRVLRNLKSVKRNFVGAQLTTEGERRNYIRKLGAYVQTIEERTEEAKRELPHSKSDTAWDMKVAKVDQRLKEVVAMCGYVHDSAEKFISEGKHENPTDVPKGTPAIPSPTPYGGP